MNETGKQGYNRTETGPTQAGKPAWVDDEEHAPPAGVGIRFREFGSGATWVDFPMTQESAQTTPTQAQIEAARETPSRKVQLQCHSIVRRALETGLLIRPDQCQRCFSRPPLNKAGISQIHAHHEDHSKPLEINWLCVACHRLVTPPPSKPSGKAFGTTNGAARLNPGIVRYIRKRAKKASSRKIAASLGVDPTTVQRVISGKRWSHVQ